MMSPFSSPTAKEGSPKGFFPGDAPLKSDSNWANYWIYGGYIVFIHRHRGCSQTQTLIITSKKCGSSIELPECKQCNADEMYNEDGTIQRLGVDSTVVSGEADNLDNLASLYNDKMEQNCSHMGLSENRVYSQL